MYVAYFLKVNWILEKKTLISQLADAVHQAYTREELADVNLPVRCMNWKINFYLCFYP